MLCVDLEVLMKMFDEVTHSDIVCAFYRIHPKISCPDEIIDTLTTISSQAVLSIYSNRYSTCQKREEVSLKYARLISDILI